MPELPRHGVGARAITHRTGPMDRRTFFKTAALIGCGSTIGIGVRSSVKASDELRPAGAVSEHDFLGHCFRCAHCVDACPRRCDSPFEPCSRWDCRCLEKNAGEATSLRPINRLQRPAERVTIPGGSRRWVAGPRYTASSSSLSSNLLPGYRSCLLHVAS